MDLKQDSYIIDLKKIIKYLKSDTYTKCPIKRALSHKEISIVRRNNFPQNIDDSSFEFIYLTSHEKKENFR